MEKILFVLFSFTICISAQSQVGNNKKEVAERKAVKPLPPGKRSLKSAYWSTKKPDSLASFGTPSTNSLDAGDPKATTMPPTVLPSPKSTSLVNLISENVDLYTGKTSIALPLYTIKSGSLSLPVSLQSNINAHKVNDIGSWVGLGMNLNPGGVITRVMKNLPDEFTGWISPTFPINGWGFTKLKPSQSMDLTNFEAMSFSDQRYVIARGNWNQIHNLPDVAWDVEPDEFYFNFGNYSGKFVFDQDGGINLIPRANLKITPFYEVINGNNKLTGFTVLTEDGTKYEFGNSSGNSFSTAPVEETKLTINNSSIQFSYRAVTVNSSGVPVQLGGAVIYTPEGYAAYERVPYVLGGIPEYAGNTPPTPPNIPEEACCLRSFIDGTSEALQYPSYTSSWMLKKVTSPGSDEINLSYTSTTQTYLADRSYNCSLPDMAEDVYIWGGTSYSRHVFTSPISPVHVPNQNIYIHPAGQNFTISNNNIELKSKTLSTITTSEGSTVTFNSNTPREDFLNDNRLDNIEIKNSDNTVVKRFSFNYNVINTTSTESPDDNFKFLYHKSLYDWVVVGGINQYQGMRSFFTSGLPATHEEQKSWPVTSDMRKRMLLSTVYEEANGQSLPPYIFNYNTSVKLPFRTSVNQDKFGYANSNPTGNPFVGTSDDNRFFYSYKWPWWQNSVVLGAPVAQSGGVTLPIVFFKTQTSTGGWSDPIYGGTKSAAVIPMGGCVLTKVTYPTGGYKQFTFEFNGNSVAWNGLRVNRIEEYESSTATPITTDYSYSSFVNTDAPVYNYKLPELLEVLNGTLLTSATIRQIFTSGRVNGVSSTRGATGGYSFAEIAQPGNGKKRVEFTTPSDFPDVALDTKLISCFLQTSPAVSPFKYPYAPAIASDWKRGLVKKEIIYNAAGAPVKYDEYVYHATPGVFGEKIIPAFNVSNHNVKAWITGTNPCISSPNYIDWTWFQYAKYGHTSAWYPLAKKISRIYGTSGTQYSEDIEEYDYTQYTYNSRDYLFATQTKNLHDSKNNQVISRTTNPLDYASSGSSSAALLGINNLKNNHVLNVPIEQFSYKEDASNNRKYFFGLIKQYHTNKPFVKELYKLKTDGLISSITVSNATGNVFNQDIRYNLEQNFPLYDVKGRPLEQFKTNDIKEGYKWNYNRMYPVAKGVNAGNAEISYSSFEADEADAKINFIPAQVINNASNAFTGSKYYQPASDYPHGLNVDLTNLGGKDYSFSFWYKGDPVLVHTYGSNTQTISPAPSPVKTRVGWNYYEFTVPGTWYGTLHLIKSFSAPANTYVDEVRFAPKESQLTTYTFTPLVGMTSETDLNNKVTYYEYDALNRLSVVRNEHKDIVKTICYNYAGQSVPCNLTACPAPVINSVVRSLTNVTLTFTAPSGSTNCVVQLTDLSTNTTTTITTGCTSPATITLPSGTAPYRVSVTSYSAACPAGTVSVAKEI